MNTRKLQKGKDRDFMAKRDNTTMIYFSLISFWLQLFLATTSSP